MHSATEGFYFQAFNGSVALNVAGYDYNSVWTPLLAGLSPARTAASFAALIRLTFAIVWHAIDGLRQLRLSRPEGEK